MYMTMILYKFGKKWAGGLKFKLSFVEGCQRSKNLTLRKICKK